MRFSLRCEGDGNLRSFVTIVVDVANVMGSRPDGWWRDRAGAAVRLHAQIARLAASGGAILPPPGNDEDAPEEDTPAFVLVLEGAARAAVSRLPAADPGQTDAARTDAARTDAARTDAARTDAARTDAPRPGEVRVVEASGSGDDAIVAVVRELPGRRVVVTADRELRARCVAAGAEILGPGWLLGLLRP
jgi:hypothetical protein